MRPFLPKPPRVASGRFAGLRLYPQLVVTDIPILTQAKVEYPKLQ